ncbi:acetone carboxylase [Nocardioides daejeonensis]|uniref:acetone carboxylase n=1 Tax=Nocardioides daejeonensis TaxID=1046556 RepID=UPI001EF42880|nr:acetone carboxylase [Nocardioides daejeonensis]
MLSHDSGPEGAICSARGCQEPATWSLEWNNPRLHTPERRKVWLACDVHRTSLSEFLEARGFLKDVVPFL